MKYFNLKYDEIIMKVKKDGSDVNVCWKNLLEVEKMLFDDVVIVLVY